MQIDSVSISMVLLYMYIQKFCQYKVELCLAF